MMLDYSAIYLLNYLFIFIAICNNVLEAICYTNT